MPLNHKDTETLVGGLTLILSAIFIAFIVSKQCEDNVELPTMEYEPITPRKKPAAPDTVVIPAMQRQPDAYDGGYNEGFEQGWRDARKGNPHGSNYDDHSLYDRDATNYKKGYKAGYDDGFNY